MTVGEISHRSTNFLTVQNVFRRWAKFPTVQLIFLTVQNFKTEPKVSHRSTKKCLLDGIFEGRSFDLKGMPKG
jgi:hypothetical protein